jgi:hypothetical protein
MIQKEKRPTILKHDKIHELNLMSRIIHEFNSFIFIENIFDIMLIIIKKISSVHFL